jgi:hypothetical protein
MKTKQSITVNGTIRQTKDTEEAFKSGWMEADMKDTGDEIKLM